LHGIPSAEASPLGKVVDESTSNQKLGDVLLDQIISRLRKTVLQKEEISHKDKKHQQEVMKLKQRLK
jgi:hypothetical protein